MGQQALVQELEAPLAVFDGLQQVAHLGSNKLFVQNPHPAH